MIETISKRGYRLLPSAIAEPGAASSLAGSPFSQPTRLDGGRRRGGRRRGAGLVGEASRPQAETIPVIVLPVNPIRREPPQLSLAAALTVDLVGLLARERRFHVTVRKPDPAMAGVRSYAIYADLQIADGRLRTHVEIMSVDTEQALWSRIYEQPYDGKLLSQTSCHRPSRKTLPLGSWPWRRQRNDFAADHSGQCAPDGETRRAVDLAFPPGAAELVVLPIFAIGGYDYQHFNADDAFGDIAPKMAETDKIIFATPVYWYAMSAPLKIFFDRLDDLTENLKALGKNLRTSQSG